MKTLIVPVAAFWFLSALIAPAAAQTAPPSEAGKSSPKTDPRMSLQLDPAVQETLKQTMREHLESLRDIIAALSDGKTDEAARIAREELGFAKHHEIMQREKGATFPEKYQELAMAHHQAAEDLARALSAGKMEPILKKLDLTVKACVACHRVYKL
jgi:hypothetical protein